MLASKKVNVQVLSTETIITFDLTHPGVANGT